MTEEKVQRAQALIASELFGAMAHCGQPNLKCMPARIVVEPLARATADQIKIDARKGLAMINIREL